MKVEDNTPPPATEAPPIEDNTPPPATEAPPIEDNTEPPVLFEKTENGGRIPIQGICQYPEFPTGCESTAAVTVLRFYGLDLSVAEFVSGIFL